MYRDYIDAILALYNKKRETNDVSQNMIEPTPAQLKDECFIICNERFEQRDISILKIFFGEGTDKKTALKAIEDYPTDKFKPLVNFLKNKTKDPEKKTVELLAWLIDFKPRPFELGRKYVVNLCEAITDQKDVEDLKEDKEVELIIENESTKDTEQAIRAAVNSVADSSTKRNLNLKKMIGPVILLVLISGSIYWFSNTQDNSNSPMSLSLNESCMYWTGEQYEQISCGQKRGDTLIIALDTEKLKRLKRITQTDTISYNSRGFVWYVKINGELEYYTSDGQHPVHQQLRLRPITDYIIRKYIKGETN
ncbi:hypothetical protein [Gynurincola endophyticus]|uniref:hypothetical protein n=1 Tax=Gynurincola endophyticus TaxID=2479004 RepID=UPI000F8CA526|nr:hypothetical protein [Gynurincola endophyticus]